MDPYLRPLYDALEDMMPHDRVQKALETRTIEIAPLAYMRGRTLADAFIILDEAQNATGAQMKMFLTRLGVNSKVGGDRRQDPDRPAQAGRLGPDPDRAGAARASTGIAFCYLRRDRRGAAPAGAGDHPGLRGGSERLMRDGRTERAWADAAGSSLLNRFTFHAARWGLILIPALATRLAYPPVTAGGFVRTWVGPVLYNLVILSIFWLLLALYRRETYGRLREMVFFAALFTLSIVLADLLDGLFPSRAEPLPIPLAAILVTLLYNGRIAITCAITLAVLLGTQGGQTDAATLFFGMAGGVAGAISMRVVRRRSQVLVSIAAITLAYAIAAFTFGLMAGWTADDMIRSAGIGAVVALVSTSVAMALLPLAEWLTRITTDLRLLELADPSRPLLKRLATEAPGTWAHSLQMANLCEVACNAIQANGLLARVGCYYHDVGKLVGPLYFAENQQGGRNPHDDLPPVESARIIRQHVVYGLELADQARLPEAVRRFIAEHHGTSRMEYFFEQAQKPDGAEAGDESAFEYPGPRPRTAETAVAMLADSAEAAVRVLDEPTPERVREAVDYLIAQKIAAGQLREAPLTLRDLDRVGQEFARLLAGMYHTRVEYPSGAGGITADFGRD